MLLLLLAIAILLLLAIAIGREIICFLSGHDWSPWYPWITRDKEYRYCSRCAQQQFRIGLMVVNKNKNPKERFQTICNRFISLTKPSFGESLEIASRKASENYYSKIPRDVLNDGIKCLANEMTKIKDFDSLRLDFVDCPRCRNCNFCDDIIRSMRKAFKKYERKEKVRLRLES